MAPYRGIARDLPPMFGLGFRLRAGTVADASVLSPRSEPARFLALTLYIDILRWLRCEGALRSPNS